MSKKMTVSVGMRRIFQMRGENKKKKRLMTGFYALKALVNMGRMYDVALILPNLAISASF